MKVTGEASRKSNFLVRGDLLSQSTFLLFAFPFFLPGLQIWWQMVPPSWSMKQQAWRLTKGRSVRNIRQHRAFPCQPLNAFQWSFCCVRKISLYFFESLFIKCVLWIAKLFCNWQIPDRQTRECSNFSDTFSMWFFPPLRNILSMWGQLWGLNKLEQWDAWNSEWYSVNVGYCSTKWVQIPRKCLSILI